MLIWPLNKGAEMHNLDKIKIQTLVQHIVHINTVVWHVSLLPTTIKFSAILTLFSSYFAPT